MTFKKAEDLKSIYRAFRGEPLELDQMEFYQETKEARGGADLKSRIRRKLENNLDRAEHILFVGYKGCGKSTELNRMQKDIQERFLVVNFSISKELDPVSLEYIEIFITTMEKLFALALQKDLAISRDYLQNIQNWIATKEVEEIREKHLDGELEVGVEGEIGLPFLAKFFAKFKASAKASKSLKDTLKKNIEPKLADLIALCNELITEIRLNLTKIQKDDILLIIEDLDKIPLTKAEELFFNYTHQLTQLRTNVIYTFPIALYYNTRFNNIKANFADICELPMIKVQEQNGTKNQKGVNGMQQIVEARMNMNLFEDASSLEEMILKSGGCLRDLFVMINEAADHAMDFDRTTMTKEDCTAGYLRLKREYENSLADYVVDGQKRIAVKSYYEALQKLYINPHKKVDNSEEELHLRQNLCILGYNGVGWQDVHPIVKDILKERGLVQ